MAAWLGPKRLSRAVFYATLTNIVAFVPLLLVKGKTGDFIYSLPIVVSFSLLASMIVAWTFAPLLGFYILKGQKGFEVSEGKPARVPTLYKTFVESALPTDSRNRIALPSPNGPFMVGDGTSFFPKDLHDVFVVNLDLPEGSPIRETRDVALDAVRKIDALEGKGIRSYTTFVGAGGPRFWLSIEPEQRSDNYAQILVHTASKEETAEIVARLKKSFRFRSRRRACGLRCLRQARLSASRCNCASTVPRPKRFANWPRRSRRRCARSPGRWTSTTTGAIQCSR
jgi:multidrug efflux pump subunit AcrB